MENGREWTEDDFKDFDSWKRLQAKVNCINAIMAYRMALENLEAKKKAGMMT